MTRVARYLSLVVLLMFAPLALAQTSDPADQPPECEADPEEEAERAQKAERADHVKALGLLTEQTVAEAFESADVYWESRERALTQKLSKLAEAWRLADADVRDVGAGPPTMNTEGCRGLARRDTSVCWRRDNVEGEDLIRRLCIGMVTYLKLRITDPDDCFKIKPVCADPDDEDCIRKKAQAGFVDSVGLCRFFASGDLALCQDAPAPERMGCLWTARELQREFTACQEPYDQNGCEAAIYVQISRHGQAACDDLQQLTDAGLVPIESGAVAKCEAIYNGRPEQCPEEPLPPSSLLFRAQGEALLRASSGVAWLVQSVVTNGPALCHVSSTVQAEGTQPLVQASVLQLDSSRVPVSKRTRLGPEVHAVRSKLSTTSVCVPTLSWADSRPRQPSH